MTPGQVVENVSWAGRHPKFIAWCRWHPRPVAGRWSVHDEHASYADTYEEAAALLDQMLKHLTDDGRPPDAYGIHEGG